MRASDRKKKFEVLCGKESGLFDITLFGPGGGSRCIQFGEHLITPIEFEALAGKKSRNWRTNIKVDGKPIKNYFETNNVKACEDKNCECTNCNIGRKFPTDLELLIEKVYLNKTYDLSIVKKEKEEKEVKKKMLNKDDDNSVDEVKDEFFSSPETTPKKKKRSSMETPVDEILPVADKSPTTSELKLSEDKDKNKTSPIHVVTSSPIQMSPILDIPEENMIRDEIAPSKQQKDIRSYMSGRNKKSLTPTKVKSPGSLVPTRSSQKSPGAASDCSVELISEGKPENKVTEVDLTENNDGVKSPEMKSPKIKTPEIKTRRGPGRPRRQSPPSKSETNEVTEVCSEGADLLKILREEKNKVSPRKRLPRDVKSSNVNDETKGAVTANNTDNKIGAKRKPETEEFENELKKNRVLKDSDRKQSPNKQEQQLTKTPNKSESVNNTSLTPVKVETTEPAITSPSPSKIPTYTNMIRAALDEMNCVGGEGCTKLEILLYILRKFKPKGSVEQITTKLIEVLEVGTKKGDFLSSVSCPRKLKKEVKEIKKEKDIKKEPIEIKKGGKAEEAKKKLDKKVKSNEKLKDKKLKKAVKDDKKDKSKKLASKQDSKTTPKLALPKKLLEPLSTICKAKKLTRQETIRKIWVYIKLKKLQDPSDKNIIICDDNMKKITKCKKIQQSKLMAYVKPFMVPLKSK